MSEIKIGSRVKLTKPTYKWRGWVDEMNKSVNKEFIIESVKYDTGVFVEADIYLRNGTVNLVDDLFIYPLDCFELVEEKKMSFKVGDRVRVVKPVNEEHGWKSCWIHYMSEAIGKIDIIQRINEYGVYFESSESNRNSYYGFGFPPSSLELVTDVTLSPKFKVGDQVRVVKRVTEENGWENCWTTMDKYIGTVQTIRDINSTGVYFTSNDFGFPPSSLELVTDVTSTPKFKCGDRVRVVKRVTEENGWENTWNSTMDKYIGTAQTIRFIGATGVYFTGIHNYDWGFPPSSLELYVEPKSTVQSQDPIIKYQYLKGTDFHTVNGWADNLCLTIATKIKTSKVHGNKTVEWSVAFKHPNDQFNKSLARAAVNSKTPKRLFLGKQYSRDEIVAKILADLVYNDYFLSDEYRKFVRMVLKTYSGVI